MDSENRDNISRNKNWSTRQKGEQGPETGQRNTIQNTERATKQTLFKNWQDFLPGKNNARSDFNFIFTFEYFYCKQSKAATVYSPVVRSKELLKFLQFFCTFAKYTFYYVIEINTIQFQLVLEVPQFSLNLTILMTFENV